MNTAMPTPAPTEIERLVKGIGIPPRPEVLTRLQKEIDSPNMSLSVVGQIINGDVALAASVMKVANSPAFGLSRKVSTVQQAIRCSAAASCPVWWPALPCAAASTGRCGWIVSGTAASGSHNWRRA
jgi:hypothetical protein